ARRLLAAKELGWLEIPVTVVDLDQIVRGEFAENAHRKDFTVSESVAIKRAIESLERPAAKERQREHGNTAPGKKHSGQVAPSVSGRAADMAARATGKSRRTLEKAEAVMDAAEENPERYGDLHDRLDRHDAKVDGIYRELKQRKARADYESKITLG